MYVCLYDNKEKEQVIFENVQSLNALYVGNHPVWRIWFPSLRVKDYRQDRFQIKLITGYSNAVL